MSNIPTRLNNPGDLKDPATGTFRTFADPQSGFSALEGDLQGKMSGNTRTGLTPQSTLKDFSNVWAPSSDNNNPDQYASKLAAQLNVTPDTPIGSLGNRIHDFASAIANNEGFQGGIVSADTVPSATQKMSISDFATKIKDKYPQYDNVDDTALVQKILQKYPQYSSSVETSGVPKEPIPIPDDSQPGLGDQLASRVNQVSQSLTDAQTGKINWGSGVLQAAGGISGGVGDALNAGLEAVIPPLRPLEKMLGNAIGKLIDTPDGQALVNSGKEFAQAHPEISGDLGAAINVASILPIFRGLSLAKGAITDSVSSVFKTQLESAAKRELTDGVGSTITGRNLMDSAAKRGLDPIKTMATEDGGAFLPDIRMSTDGRPLYDATKSYSAASKSLDADEETLQEKLDAASKTFGAQKVNVGTVSLDRLRTEAIDMAKSEFSDSAQVGPATKEINRIFDDYESTKGSNVLLPELNMMKRGLRKAVNFKSPKLESDVNYQVGQMFMNTIEKRAENAGITGVREINRTMASKIEALKALKLINGKLVKSGSGFGGKVFKAAATIGESAGGEAIGNMAGVPFAGALAGPIMGTLIPKQAGLATNLLRGAQKPLSTVANEARQGLVKTATGLGAQALQKRLQK